MVQFGKKNISFGQLKKIVAVIHQTPLSQFSRLEELFIQKHQSATKRREFSEW